MDQKTRRQFSRIYGGFAWPTEKPGFLAVLGEREQWTTGPSMVPEVNRRFYLLAETESADLTELIQNAIALTGEFSLNGWYGRLDPKRTDSIDEYNRAAVERRLPRFYLNEAPHADRMTQGSAKGGLISIHLDILKSCLDAENKKLWLNLEGTILPQAMRSIQEHEVAQARDAEFPSLAALAYAVSALEILRSPIEEERDMIEGERILTEINLPF